MEILLSPPVLLTLAVIFVNGWTDAPNAIATAVGTGALRMGRAIALAAVCNLLGAVLSAALCPAVAATVLEIGDFSGRAQAQTALCAALTAQQLPFAQGEPLAPHTTFKIGGPAAFWCTPRDAEQLRRTLQLCRENGVRVYLLGNGSNTLFDDAGFDGAVIDMRGLSGMENSGLDTDAVRITAGAGQTLGRLCSKAQTLGLTGLEFACGIPGTVGGAVYMNAGAYGSELKDVLESVTFLDSDLQLRTLPVADLAMGYRTSIFEQNPDWCILSATVVLHRGDGAAVLARMQELLGKRREKQPLEWPSAGSTFKRPQGAFAGKLIEDCGLRGFTVGGAQISEKHCGFVINRGGATCADVVALTEQVRQIVEARTGFVLEREIRVVK